MTCSDCDGTLLGPLDFMPDGLEQQFPGLGQILDVIGLRMSGVLQTQFATIAEYLAEATAVRSVPAASMSVRTVALGVAGATVQVAGDSLTRRRVTVLNTTAVVFDEQGKGVTGGKVIWLTLEPAANVEHSWPLLPGASLAWEATVPLYAWCGTDAAGYVSTVTEDFE